MRLPISWEISIVTPCNWRVTEFSFANTGLPKLIPTRSVPVGANEAIMAGSIVCIGRED